MAAATILLLTADVWPDVRGRTEVSQSPVVTAEVQMIEQTVREAGLPASVAASLARRMVTSRPPALESRSVAEQVFDQEERR